MGLTMQTFFSEDHRLHFPQAELSGEEVVTPFERPSRVEYVLSRLRDRGCAAVTDPGPVAMAPVRRLLDQGLPAVSGNGMGCLGRQGPDRRDHRHGDADPAPTNGPAPALH
jgi:hypothetical protein